jgi:hypothetical protein
VDIRKNDGFGITGLANIGTDLYVFKNTSISRFGTTTFSISGTVSTLGPLETINYYLGVNNGYNVCQMTDGRVAFLASDNNLYIYDGNSLFNASVQSYPNPDLRLAFGGASNSISDSVVCENPYEKIIYLLGVGTSQAFGYDYVNNFWFKTGSYTGVGGGTSTNFYSAVNTIGSSPSFTPSRILIGGGGNNAVYVSNTNDAADTNCIATMTIRLPYRRKEGIPRSAIFELNLGGGLSSANIRARAGINALPSTFGYTNATAAAGRYVIPIALPSLATSGQPTEQNALVELTILAGSAASFGDVYLSDEIQ